MAVDVITTVRVQSTVRIDDSDYEVYWATDYDEFILRRDGEYLCHLPLEVIEDIVKMKKAIDDLT